MIDEKDILDLIVVIGKTQELQIKLLGSINIKLDKLVNQETIEKPAKKIVETLKQEEKHANKIINQVKDILDEEVIMDLKNIDI